MDQGDLPQPPAPGTEEDSAILPPARAKELERHNLEGQLAVIKDFRRLMTGMAAASREDTTEVITQETDQLRQLQRQAEEAVPQAVSQFKRYQELQALTQAPTTPYDQLRAYSAEADRILEDQDVAFLASITDGTEDIIDKRHQIREVLKQLGDRSGDPAAYAELLPEDDVLLAPLAGHIEDVVIHNSSITLIVDDEAYEEEAPPGSVAHHVAGTIWNVSRTEEALEGTEASASLGRTSLERLLTLVEEDFYDILDHENWHSILDGFHIINEWPTSMVVNTLRDLASLQRGEPIPPYISIKDRQEAIADLQTRAARLIPGLADRFQIELVIDILRGQFFPAEPAKRCDRMHQADRGAILRDLQTDGIQVDESLQPQIERLKQPDDTFSRIDRLFQRVYNQHPDRKEDLDGLFVLYPPSQIQTIEDIVSNWLEPIADTTQGTGQ